MFNLLMAHAEGYWDNANGTDFFEQDRFLTYTHKVLQEKYSTLSDEVIEQLVSFPALFAYEKGTETAARVGWIKAIRRRSGGVEFDFDYDDHCSPIPPETMQQLWPALDFGKNEEYRSHWALKEVDLLTILADAGFVVKPPKSGTDMRANNRIFLAHAQEDKQQVRSLYVSLKDRGFNPWLDEVDLIPGQIWKDEIPKAIAEASVFLACLSTQSINKVGYVQNEFRRALASFGKRPAGSIYFIPVRLDDCDVPDIRIPDLELSLKDIQWVDLWQKGGLDRLEAAIERAVQGSPTVKDSSKNSDDRAVKKDSAELIMATPAQGPESRTSALAAPRAEEESEGQAAEKVVTQATFAEPLLAKASVEGTQKREPKLEKSSRWRNPALVAAIISAIATVAAALLGLPLLDRHFNNGEQAAAPQNTVTPKSMNAPGSTTPTATAQDGYVVQVTTQPSADQAQAAFADMQRRYKSVLGGFEATIQRADLGAKGIYYRARVGPMESRDAALRLCEQLKSAGGNCFVTR